MIRNFKYKRALFFIISIIAFAAIFWLESRYPALNEKEQMGTKVAIREALSFSPLLEIKTSDHVLVRIIYSTINWLNTNWRGMSFGILLAASFMGLFSLIPLDKIRSRFSMVNTFIGVITGAPLGVCVNCATPISQGLYASGANVALILGILKSSPMLNFVALIMLFNLFPYYFAWLLVGVTLAYLLLLLPLLLKLIDQGDYQTVKNLFTHEVIADRDMSWGKAVSGFLTLWWSKLFYIIKMTLPLMFLAGFLGSVLAEFLPLDQLFEQKEGVGIYFLVALTSTFLPVPMTFNLVVAHTLFKMGLPLGVSFTLCFTLGIYSIFPFLVIWKDVAKKLAVMLYVAVAVVGAVGGLVSQELHENYVKRNKELLSQNIHKMIHGQESLDELIKKTCAKYHESELNQRCTRQLVLNSVIPYVGEQKVCELIQDDEQRTLCQEKLYFRQALNDGVGKAACQKIRDTEKRTFCLEELILIEATNTEDSSVCSKYQNLEKREQCLEKVLYKKGTARHDRSLCLKIKDSALKRDCLSSVYRYETIFNKSSEHCHKFTDQKEKDRCLRAFVLTRVNLGAEASICELLSQENQPECQLNVYQKRALVLQSSEPCLKIKDGYSRAECLAYTSEKIKAVSIEEACKNLTVPEQKYCLNLYRQNQALSKQGKNSDCEQLKNPRAKKICLAQFYRQAALAQNRPELCLKLAVDSNKRHCALKVYNAQMTELNSIDQCYEVADRDLADYCKESFIVYLQSYFQKVVEAYRLKKVNQLASRQLIIEKTSDSRVMVQSHQRIPKAPNLVWQERQDKNIKISSFLYQQPKKTKEWRFRRLEGRDIGIIRTHLFKPQELVEPLAYGRGIAVGDYNKDGFEDLVLATSEGPLLYKNIGGKFHLMPLALEKSAEHDTVQVAFVDINNDGHLDIYCSSYGGHNFFLLNDQNEFKTLKKVALKKQDALITLTTSFGDINRDGMLDVYLGNWMFGKKKNQNSLLLNNKMTFSNVSLPQDTPAPTLSSLMSDINQDGFLDLIVGNDFESADLYYLGSQEGLRFFERNQSLLPYTSEHTMSIDSGDMNNDGRLDLFTTDFTFAGVEREYYCETIKDLEAQKRCERNRKVDHIVRRSSVDQCLNDLNNEADKFYCLMTIQANMARSSKNPKLCDSIPASFTTQRLVCETLAHMGVNDSSSLYNNRQGDREINHHFQESLNVLLVANQDKGFKNREEDFGLEKSSWSWNAKFADLDNDGFQDLYIGNGIQGFAIGRQGIYPNYFFHNKQGRTFASVAEKHGLDDVMHTPSFVYTDMDLDGDLDIIATAVNGPVRIFENIGTPHGSLSFSIHDEVGNYFGIGTKISLVKKGKLQQLREIKASGGFLSFAAPRVSFGLGKKKTIEKIKVEWSTGETSVIPGPFQAGRHYQLTRTKP